MDQNNDPFKEIVQSFYLSGIKRGNEFQNINENIEGYVQKQYEEIDNFNELFLLQAMNSGVKCACENGCHTCCNQEVFALNIEMKIIINHIINNFPKQRQIEVLQKAEEKLNHTKDKTNAEWERVKAPCPLLANGSCSVYSIRPMACRIYLCSSKESCIEKQTNSDPNFYPSLYQLPLRCGQMMNEGFAKSLREKNIPIVEVSIEQALVSEFQSINSIINE